MNKQAGGTRLRTSILASAAIVSVLVWLRLINAHPTIHLRDVTTTAVSFRVAKAGGDRHAVVLNETLPSQRISLTGFTAEVSFLDPNHRPPLLSHFDSAREPLVLRRADQLHLKDLHVSPRALVSNTVDHDIISIVVSGVRSRADCYGRIGVGQSLMLGPPEGALAPSPRVVHPSSPNMSISCPIGPCGIVAQLRPSTTTHMTVDLPVDRLSFERTPQESQSSNAESGILSGSLEVEAVDVLHRPFRIKIISLPAGSTLGIPSVTLASVAIDARSDSFLVDGDISTTSSLTVRNRVGAPVELVPSILELLLEEPWHKTLITLVLTMTPTVVQLFRRRVRRVRPGRIR